jgi:hypothetical protein
MKSKLIMILLTPLLLSACAVGTYYDDGPYGYSPVYPGYTYGYDDYYFYPGIGVYFHIYSGDYFYIHNGHWIRSHYLPRHYHLHHKHRRHIVHHGGKPYHDYDKHKKKYRDGGHYRSDSTSDRHERDNIRKDHESSIRKKRDTHDGDRKHSGDAVTRRQRSETPPPVKTREPKWSRNQQDDARSERRNKSENAVEDRSQRSEKRYGRNENEQSSQGKETKTTRQQDKQQDLTRDKKRNKGEGTAEEPSDRSGKRHNEQQSDTRTDKRKKRDQEQTEEEEITQPGYRRREG